MENFVFQLKYVLNTYYKKLGNTDILIVIAINDNQIGIELGDTIKEEVISGFKKIILKRALENNFQFQDNADGIVCILDNIYFNYK